MCTIAKTTRENRKNVSKNLSNGNNVYMSLSQVLNDMKRTSHWAGDKYESAFAEIGWAKDDLTPAKIKSGLADANMILLDKKSQEPVICVWREVTKKDADGNVVTDADGNEVKENVLRQVRRFTPNLVWNICEQISRLSK